MSKKKGSHYHGKGNKEQQVKRIQKRIYSYLADMQGKSLNYKQIAAALNISSTQERNLLIESLKLLEKNNKIEEPEIGKYCINVQEQEKIGKIDVTQNENAYVIVEGEDTDIFISKKKKGNALHGDTVRVQIISNLDKPEGQVIEVVERNKTDFVGVFQHSGQNKFGFVVIDNSKIHIDFFINHKDFNAARDGDKVLVQLSYWNEKDENPRGIIKEVFGKPGQHDAEIHAILAEYELPYKFKEEVEIEASKIPVSISKEEIAKRRDMRGIPTFTIDPKDAQDFDDALSIRTLENNLWEIGVHIADVSHYVLPQTILDQEAYERATSVYLVDRVVPMLPEVLSNQVCSLRPKEEKLTYSAVFILDENANVKEQWFGRTVIYSDKRFTYEDAQEIIEKKDKSTELGEEILLLDTLAKKLRNQRLKEGAISFDKMEVKFRLDENFTPVEVYFKHSKDANHLIEEFMLLANKKVSEYVSMQKDGKPSGKTFIYRIHDEPDNEKLTSLNQFIKPFGYHLDLRSKATLIRSINKLLHDIKGKPEENMIETLTMRTMSKAVYSTSNIGHYGLAFEHYSHFTSPIRRYPDIIAHRLLQHYLDGGKSPEAAPYEKDCKHCSARERLAADAERDSIKYMQVKLMQKHVGEVFDGVISGATDWGIYVELPLSLSEGLIKLKDIKEDHFVYDSKNHAIVGKRTQEKYQLGDKIRVKIIGANLEKKQLDFELIEKI